MISSRFVLDKKGVRELLKSQELMEVCEQKAKDIASATGKDYITSSFVGFDRVNVTVKSNSEDAYWDDIENNTLEHAISSVSES